jgi:hypothetical protein
VWAIIAALLRRSFDSGGPGSLLRERNPLGCSLVDAINLTYGGKNHISLKSTTGPDLLDCLYFCLELRSNSTTYNGRRGNTGMAESTTQNPDPNLGTYDHQHYVCCLEGCVWSYELAQIHAIRLPADHRHCK